ncbi:hypothetical protein NL676_021312 [Syzygium grande]|nr:hypothetical protein NL676_021312 [Syzygium grande]
MGVKLVEVQFELVGQWIGAINAPPTTDNGGDGKGMVRRTIESRVESCLENFVAAQSIIFSINVLEKVSSLSHFASFWSKLGKIRGRMRNVPKTWVLGLASEESFLSLAEVNDLQTLASASVHQHLYRLTR